MTTLVDDIKRLRELDAKRADGNWYAHDDNQKLNACIINDSKEGWDRMESDYTLIDADESPNLEPDDIAFIAAAPDAIRTINALVELVGEMRGDLALVLKLIEYGDGDVILKGSAAHKGIVESVTKSAPIAALAKGE